MKKIGFILIALSYTAILSAQIDYVPQYVPMDVGAMKNALDKKQAHYDYNKEYIKKLIDWIFELKSQTDDIAFRNAMDLNYKKLRSFDNQDLTLYDDEIRDIELNIKEEIDKYNTRINEANNPRKYWELGNEFLKNQNYAKAIENFNMVVKLSPEFSGAYFYRGYAYHGLNNLTLAQDDYSKYIQLEPNDPVGFQYRGLLYENKNDYLSALADFNKFVELSPSSAQAYFNRAHAKMELNDYNGAIKDNLKAIEIEPNFSMAYNNIAWSKFLMQKYSEALIDVNKAIELDPQNYVALDTRAEIKFNLKNYKGCIEDADKAIELNPKLENSYFLEGRAYYRLGEKTKACEYWSKAGELGKVEAYDYISKYCNN